MYLQKSGEMHISWRVLTVDSLFITLLTYTIFLIELHLRNLPQYMKFNAGILNEYVLYNKFIIMGNRCLDCKILKNKETHMKMKLVDLLDTNFQILN